MKDLLKGLSLEEIENLAEMAGVDVLEVKRPHALLAMKDIFEIGIVSDMVTTLINAGAKDIKAAGADLEVEAGAVAAFLMSCTGATNGTMVAVLLATLRALFSAMPDPKGGEK